VIGVSWYREGIVFGEGPNGIMRVSPNGGRPESLATVKEGESAYVPEMLPDGQTLLFTIVTGSDGTTARVVGQSLKSGERRIVIEHGADARHVPTGDLVYSGVGTVFAAPFDSRRLLVTSGAVPVVEGVRSGDFFSVSGTGTLIYLSGPMPAAAGQMDLGFVSRTGVVEPLKLPPRPYEHPRVSPDGQRVVFDTNDDTGAIVSIYDLAGTTGIRRLTYGGRNRFPIWSPNGQRVTFQSDRDGDAGLFWQLADGTGPAERLTKADPSSAHVPESWSPDGEHLLYSVTKGARVSLWSLSIKEKTAAPFDAGTYAEPTTAVFSPDGHFVAYAGAEVQGRGTVYVQPFPPTSARYQLPSAPGDNPHHPLWSPDGKELFYIPRPLGFEVVAVSTSPTFAFSRPVALPRAFPTAGPTTPRIFDVTPDGRFMSVVLPGPAQSAPFSSQIVVVVNWLDELMARMTTK
jgi:Tol biopolymer transport system component